MKRGISPLVATVSVVAIAITVTALVIAFGTNITERLIERAEKPLLEQECQDLEIDIKDYCQTNTWLELSIRNNGLKKISSIDIALMCEKGTTRLTKKIDLNPAETKELKIEFDPNEVKYLNLVQITPRITIEDTEYPCEYFRSSISYVPVCKGYIIRKDQPQVKELIECYPDSFNIYEEPSIYEKILDIFRREKSYITPDIPRNYEQIIPSFSLNCDNIKTSEFQVNIPAIFENVTIIKCQKGICKPISSKEIESLGCPYEPELFDFQKIGYSLIPIEERLTSKNQIIEQDQFKFEYLGDNETYIRISSPEEIKEPEIPHTRFLSLPVEIEIDITGESAPFSIKMPYSEELAKDNAFGAYINVDDEWKYIISRLDEKEQTLTIDIDLKEYLNGIKRAYLGIIGTFCPGCVEPILKKVHEPLEETKQAIILVHGLFGGSYVWENVVEELQLTNQPAQIWTFEYPAGKPYQETAIILANEIERIHDEFDTIHIVGKSLGGLVVRNNLYYAYIQNLQNMNEYQYIRKVSSAILIGVPNKGSPFAEFGLDILQRIIRQTQGGLINFQPESIKQLRDVDNTPTVPWINYYSISGTKTYEFAGISATDLFFQGKPNDGIVSLDSTLYLGDKNLKTECSEYWTVPGTHIFLQNTKDAKLILGKLINRELHKENPIESYFGYTNYYSIPIFECSDEDTYFIIGQKTEYDKRDEKFLCSCGDGICSGIETPINCPEDCPIEQHKIFSYIILLFILIIISLLIRQKIKKFYNTKISEKDENKDI